MENFIYYWDNYWFLYIIFWFLLTFIGVAIAIGKGRSGVGWFFLIIFFGLIPFIVLCCLPSCIEEYDTNSAITHSVTKNNPIEDLNKLNKLFNDGVITEEEFNETKKLILEKINNTYKN